MGQPARKVRYESEMQAIKRVERYYPSTQLKQDLNAYMMEDGCKSELAVRLLRSYFAAKKKEGQEPRIIELLPQI